MAENPGKSWENHGKTLDSRWNGLDMTGWLFKLLKDDDATIHSHPFLSLLRSFTTMPLDAHKNQHGCACKLGFQGFIINNFPINLPCWGVFGTVYPTFRDLLHFTKGAHTFHTCHPLKAASAVLTFHPNDRQWPSLCRVTTLSRSSCGQNAKVGFALNRNKSYLVDLCCCPMLTKQNKTNNEHWHHS